MGVNAKNKYDAEIKRIKETYFRRKNLSLDFYHPIAPYMYMIKQEKERAFIRCIYECGLLPVENKRLLEVGCGNGNNLLQFINLGFLPSNLVGNELLPERAGSARTILPSSVKILEGNALDIDFPDESFDIVFQSMVFSSILDEDFQNELARRLWQLVKPGGGIMWYDFIYNNPRNKDVKGVSYSRVKALFSGGKVRKYKITLAPPISRVVTKLHPLMYSAFNIFPFLRTHILCWILKQD